MSTNMAFPNARQLFLNVGAGVLAGAPVQVGAMTGVAMTNADANGNATVDFGGAYTLTVNAVDDTGNAAVAVGDPIFFVGTDTIQLSKKASGLFFGCALATLSAGSNGAIAVSQESKTAAIGGADAKGAILPSVMAIQVRNQSGGTLNAGTLVYISGWDATSGFPLISAAANNVAGADAAWVLRTNLANNTNGEVFRTWTSTATLNTGGSSVGAPVYLSTAGGWTLTAPTGGASVHIIGRVTVVDPAVGVIAFDTLSNNKNSIGSTDMAAGAVNTAALAAAAVTFAKASVFVSTVQTGTGGAQNIAHGLGATPSGVLVMPYDLTPGTVGSYTATEGVHTSTNVVVTVTTGKTYKVLAWA